MYRVFPLRRSSLVLAALLLALPFLSSCGGGTGGQEGSAADSDLIVTYFSHGNRNDVLRNERIEVRFSAPVHPATVSDRTFRILTGPNQQTPLEGALIVDGNKIFFEPTKTQQAYDLGGAAAPPDRPFGFDPLTSYQLSIPARPSLKTLENLAGRPILKTFFATFSTAEGYLPESPAVPPEFIGVYDPNSGDPTGKLDFIPPAFRENDPTSPVLGQVVVRYDAEIVLQFSEVLDPGTVIPGETVIVQNITPPEGGSPIPVPGTIRHTKDGTRYFFVPSFHYGSGPFTIEVTLTQGITDLTGNKLLKPMTLTFNTEFEPTVNTIDFINEPFSTNDFEDVLETDAEWNTTTEGELRGGAITTSVATINLAPDGILTFESQVPYPIVSETQIIGGTGQVACSGWAQGIRWQTSYSQEELGSEGSITEFAWGPEQNALFAATYPNIQIRVAHLSDSAGVLTTTFDDNFPGGKPLPSYDGQYSVPQRANINPPGLDDGYWPYPTLTSPFDYNGINAIVMEILCSPGNTCQTSRIWFNGAVASNIRRHTLATSREAEKDNWTITGGQTPHVVYDMQITKRRRVTKAQSLWYESRSAASNYAAPIVTPPTQASGASYVLEFQGADGDPDPFNPGKYRVDPLSETVWSANIDTVDLKRFIRFRLTLNANLNSNTVPRITSLVVPYEF